MRTSPALVLLAFSIAVAPRRTSPGGGLASNHVVYAKQPLPSSPCTNEELREAAGSPDIAVDASGSAYIAFVKPNLDLVVMRECP